MDAAALSQLRALLSDRAEVKSQIVALTEEMRRIEEQIALLIADESRPVRVPGFGSVVLSVPSIVTTFDPDALRELIQSLRETGHADIADEIAGCTKQVQRAGGLRIAPERSRGREP